MKIETNSRQVPKSTEYTTDKKYNDLLYSYLQCNSDMSVGGTRVVDKKIINYSKIGADLNMSRQTASKRFKSLVELGLVVLEDGKYRLEKLDACLAALVPYKTLKLLVDAFSDYAISIYVYLLTRYIAEGERQFMTTTAQMKKFIGISTATTSNNDTITNILDVLQSTGLIEYHRKQDLEKTCTYINKVYNVPKKC